MSCTYHFIYSFIFCVGCFFHILYGHPHFTDCTICILHSFNTKTFMGRSTILCLQMFLKKKHNFQAKLFNSFIAINLSTLYKLNIQHIYKIITQRKIIKDGVYLVCKIILFLNINRFSRKDCRTIFRSCRYLNVILRQKNFWS